MAQASRIPVGFTVRASTDLSIGITQNHTLNKNFQPCRIITNQSGNYINQCSDAAPVGTDLDLNYGYNLGSANNGNVMSWSSAGWHNFSRTYSYDSLNRLASMSAPGDTCSGLTWTYDAWGNRTDQTVTGGSCNTFHQSVNTQNQLVGPPYQYDAAGNLTNDGSHSYTYDAENRLAQVDGGSTASYLYDAHGRRVRKTVGSAQTNYTYGLDGQVISEVDQNGVWMNVYLRLNGKFFAQYTIGSPRTQFAHVDHLGSTRLLTTMSQSLQDMYDYYPFGELVQGGTGTTHKFTGDERDSESNLDHADFRQYSSALARWISPDPAGLAAVDPTNPQSWNRYSYVLDNPLALTDPTGLCGGEGDTPDLPCPNDNTVNVSAWEGGWNAWFYFFQMQQTMYATLPDQLTPPQSTARVGVPSQSPVDAATQYCRDNGHLLSFKIPFTNIPVTVDATATAGPIKFSSTNDIQTVIPLAPMGPPVGAGVGFTLKIGAPKEPSPQISYGMQNGLSAGFFLNPNGTHQGFVSSFGLGVGPVYSVVLPTNNVCGIVAKSSGG